MLSAIARSEGGSGAEWKLAPVGSPATPCIAAQSGEPQLSVCAGTAYLVSVAPILRDQEGRGDASASGALRLGYLLGGTRVAAPALLASLRERQLGHSVIWFENALAHSSLTPHPAPIIIPDGGVREYEIGDSAYLGGARATQVGSQTLTAGLFSPLGPLRRALLESVATVAGIGAVVVTGTLLILSFLANRMLRPIQQLREGALRIGEGDLAHRISVRTGDELEALADQFNDMSGKLQESYADLENKVEDRTRELSESLQQQTATAEVLQVISRSKFELEPIFDIIVHSAARLCNADSVFVFQRVADAYHLVASHGFSPEYRDFVQRNPISAGRGTLVGRAALDVRITHIPDILADPEYTWSDSQRMGGFRTMLGVPLVREGESIGSLALTRRDVRPFSDKQVALVTTFADQVVIAIENVRLLEEVQARTRELAQSRLRRFLAPQVAELLVSSGESEPTLESRRCEVTVVFCDLRGFTAFAESAEPEEVMAVLREYHAALGDLIFRFEGTLERFVGDGLMVVFNDPLPVPDHPARAVRMAVAMRDCMRALSERWRRQGHELGFGIGIAQGYATVGPIGFDRRLDYSVVGSIPNMASRLCDVARAGQILVSRRVFLSIEHEVEARCEGDLSLKGFQKAVPAYEILSWRENDVTGARTEGDHHPNG